MEGQEAMGFVMKPIISLNTTDEVRALRDSIVLLILNLTNRSR